MMLRMLGVFAEFEHATIVERTKAGMEKKAKGGNFVGGNVPYGFLLDPEKGLVINEDEALIVRKMFQMYTFGKEGSSAICKQLNEAGNKPDGYFRIVHAAQDSHNVAPVAAYREQTVKIALGPKGAFENGNIGALTRQVPGDRVVSAVPRRSLPPTITESSVFPHVESFP